MRSWGDTTGRAIALHDRADDPEDDIVPGDDVYSIAQAQMRLGRLGRRRWELRRLRPSWIPGRTALLFYVVLPDRIELFLLTRADGCRRIPIEPPTTRVDLRERIQAVLRRLRGARRWRMRKFLLPTSAEDVPGTPGGWMAAGDLGELAERLGLSRVAEILGDRFDRLAIVPDDALINVPFGALPLDGRPLVARFHPFLIPEWRWTARSCRPAKRYRSGLAVAVPESEQGAGLRKLEKVDEEVARIKAALGGQVSILPAPCSRERVLGSLPMADYVHFACHGHFDPAQPSQSGLLMSDDWLVPPTLLSTRCPRLDRAVLAACWTANALVLPGREMMGLPMIFLRIGAKAVVSAIWDVDDPSSPDFMNELYRLFEASDPFDALARAQLEWWKTGRPPRDWACYVASADGITPRFAPIRWLLRACELAERFRIPPRLLARLKNSMSKRCVTQACLSDSC